VVKSPSCHCVCRSWPLSNPVIYVITSLSVHYYITLSMLLHHTHYVIIPYSGKFSKISKVVKHFRKYIFETMLAEMFSKIFFRNHIYRDVFENLTFRKFLAIRYHTHYAITSHPLCYYITPSMLLHCVQCVITYLTPRMLLHHTHYVITSHPLCYYLTLRMLLPTIILNSQLTIQLTYIIINHYNFILLNILLLTI